MASSRCHDGVTRKVDGTSDREQYDTDCFDLHVLTNSAMNLPVKKNRTEDSLIASLLTKMMAAIESRPLDAGDS